MFGRKDSPEDETQELSPVAARAMAVEPAVSPASPRNLSPATSVAAASAVAGRRSVEIPTHTSRRSERGLDSSERKLTVGKGLSLSGEISACDILVVEGKVEAKLTDGKLLEITESGQFRGTVEIENADIAGRYDGELTVHGRLTVRGTGRISGLVKYGELEVSAGGQIIGEMQTVASGNQAAGNNHHASPFKSAAKFTAATEEDDSKEKDTAAARKAS